MSGAEAGASIGAAQDDDNDVVELVPKDIQEAAEEKIEPEVKKEPEMQNKKDCRNSLLWRVSC